MNEETAPKVERNYLKGVLLFLLPSILTLAFFALPLPGATTTTTPFAIVVNFIRSGISDYLPLAALVIIIVSAFVTFVGKIIPETLSRYDILQRLFSASWLWTIIRFLGALICVMAFFKFGPPAIHAPSVGGVLLNELAPTLITIFLIAGFLIPLLTDFGLMEFVGTLIRPVFKTLFKAPGRGAIDSVASWMGSSTVGTVITINQYRAGHYTGREAAIIATNFSVCSIGFAYAMVATIDLTHLFGSIYGGVVICGMICAVFTCRLPPISLIANTYVDGSSPLNHRGTESGAGLREAWDLAINKALSAPGPARLLKRGIETVGTIYFGLLPSVFAFGGIALLIADTTPVFEILSSPLIPVLEFLQLPDVKRAAPAFIVGFADQFLTVIVGANVPAEQTRFVIAIAAIIQVIYFSELGVLLLQSPIPVNLFHIAGIFILRTLLIIPVAALYSHLIF